MGCRLTVDYREEFMGWFATLVVASLSLSASTVAELVLAAESSRCMGVTAALPPKLCP